MVLEFTFTFHPAVQHQHSALQKALVESRICLLTAGPTGTEALKNLVLPGCGSFCIVDGRVVTEKDCENNFFVSRDSIGKPRAQVTCELLAEMNPDVVGTWRADDPALVIASDPDYFAKFNLVIATQLDSRTIAALASVLEPRKIDFLVRTPGIMLCVYCHLPRVFQPS